MSGVVQLFHLIMLSMYYMRSGCVEIKISNPIQSIQKQK